MGSKRSGDCNRASSAQSAPSPDASTSGGADSPPRHKRDNVARRADIPIQVQDVIERERRRLQQASAVLSCLKIAALYQAWHEEIDAGDVAVIVQNLIDQAIDHLDLVELARSAKDLEALGASASVLTEHD